MCCYTDGCRCFTLKNFCVTTDKFSELDKVSNVCVMCVSGFTPGARELFKQENHLALYQLPSGEKPKELSSRRLHYFIKRQPPISHLISLFVRDSSSSESSTPLIFTYQSTEQIQLFDSLCLC